MIPKILLPSEIRRLLKQSGYNRTTQDVFVAVSKCETGNYTSRIFKNNNNLFGMRLPTVRQTTATGANLGHAVYSNRIDSIYDIVLYLNAVKFPKHSKDYFQVISTMKSKRYFEATMEQYFKCSKKWYYGE